MTIAQRPTTLSIGLVPTDTEYRIVDHEPEGATPSGPFYGACDPGSRTANIKWSQAIPDAPAIETWVDEHPCTSTKPPHLIWTDHPLPGHPNLLLITRFTPPADWSKE